MVGLSVKMYLGRYREFCRLSTTQRGMEGIAASRKTLLKITTTSDDENGGEAPTTTTIKGGRQTSQNRSIKSVCPVCGAIIRATKQVNLVCGD